MISLGMMVIAPCFFIYFIYFFYYFLLFFFTQVQTPVTLCSGELCTEQIIQARIYRRGGHSLLGITLVEPASQHLTVAHGHGEGEALIFLGGPGSCFLRKFLKIDILNMHFVGFLLIFQQEKRPKIEQSFLC